MADKPDNFPDWATEEQVDSVSGQTNRTEPPEFQKTSGWTRREIPPRQWWNWTLWTISRWIRWAEGRIEGLQYATEEEAKAGTEAGKVLSPLTMRQGFNADNAPPVFGVRAWANFNGGSDSLDPDAPIIIRASGNIQSISRIALGEYQITFETPMPDANYSVAVGMAQDIDSAGARPDQANVYSFTENGFVMISDANTADSDPDTWENCELLTFCVVR